MTAYMDHKNLANEVIDGVRAVQIADGVHRVLDRIASAEQHAGRDAGSVRLLAATKTRDVGEIMAAIDAGVRMIGENRPQEVMAKAEGLMARCGERGFALGVADDAGASTIAGEHIPFHLIGQLQSNKIGKVLPVVNTIESVDSLDLAEKISRRAVARGITVGVLLEVNESGEASKSGCDPSHAIRIAQKIGTLDGLELQGLMTIGACRRRNRHPQGIRAPAQNPRPYSRIRRAGHAILPRTVDGHDRRHGTCGCGRIHHRARRHRDFRRACFYLTFSSCDGPSHDVMARFFFSMFLIVGRCMSMIWTIRRLLRVDWQT